MKYQNVVVVLLSLSLTACATARNYRALSAYEITLASSEKRDTTITDVTATMDPAGNEARLLSAFFGLDNDLPRVANEGICDGAGGKDGMPVIFSHEIDVDSMQAGDFRVILASGKIGELTCVTLAPADDTGELRTALLAGEYGSEKDQPVRVEIVGNLLSIDQSVNFKGTAVEVTPLEAGPTIVLAEQVPKDRFELGKEGTELRWGGGTGCPVGTKQIVNVVWAGGVTKPGGKEIDHQERRLYKVRVAGSDGSETEVTPFAVADLMDGDNNHRLCLDVDGTPLSVSFPAGHMTDPRDDLNPDTAANVAKRSSS